MAITVNVCNQKGGVGKTTISYNLASFLSKKENFRILLVDMDPQGNLTFLVGFDSKNLSISVYHVLIGQVPLQSAIKKCQNLPCDILPSSFDLAGATAELIDEDDRIERLNNILEQVKNDYDLIIIDSPPSLGILTVNALFASDVVLIPVQTEVLAIEGLSQLLKTVKIIGENTGKVIDKIGIVMTMYKKNSKISQEVMKKILREYGDNYVFESYIPFSDIFSKSAFYKKSIFDIKDNSKAVEKFSQFSKEFLYFIKK